MDGTRKCPYCAEDIRTEAIRCPYCRSRIAALDPTRWYRDHPERRLAGVAAAVAHALALPLTIVRVGFVALTLIHLLGPVAYAALWLLLPFRPGDPSRLEQVAAGVRDWVAGLRRQDGFGPPRAGRPNGVDPHFDAVPGGPQP
jgi:phage shock protein PspC (stress-responsive transcriptional regulator)